MIETGIELLIGFDDGWLNCLSADGDLLWRFFGDKGRVGGIAAGDVDSDGEIEVVLGTDNGHIYCLDGRGRVEWRHDELAPYGRSGPNLADLDGNGSVEVLDYPQQCRQRNLPDGARWRNRRVPLAH